MDYYEDHRNAEAAKKYKELPSDVQAKLEKENPRRQVTQKEDVRSSTFTEVTKQAKEFAKKWKKTIDDVRMEHSHYEDYGSYGSEVHLEVEGLETDDQYHARLAQLYESTKHWEERDRKEFERLKAKFNK